MTKHRPYSITFLMLLGASQLCRAQTISTFAGPCPLSITTPAVCVTLLGPNGLLFDSAGNLYFADSIADVVWRIDTAGKVSTVAGSDPSGNFSGDGGPATAAEMYQPISVALDNAGNLYIADYRNNRIRKVNKGGIISTFAGNGKSDYTGDGGPATSAALQNPHGVAVDRAGNVYIVDEFNQVVRKVDTKGTITTVAGNGHQIFSGDGGPATNASLLDPEWVTLDSAGNMYISDSGHNRIRKVDTSGTITTVAGGRFGGDPGNGDGGPATNASVPNPGQVVVDDAGNVYIANGDRIRKVDTAGNITTVAGGGPNQNGPGQNAIGDGGPATNAVLGGAIGLAFDGAGNMYIAQTGPALIRKVTAPPVAPVVNALGVVNNASFALGSNPIAPGAIAAVFGSHLNNGTSVLFSSFGPDGKLVTTLAGAQATINGEPVPIFYATPTQLGIQIPTDLIGSSASIDVKVAGLTSAAQNIPIAPLAPGLFSTDQSGHGQGAILIANTNTLVAPAGSIPGRDARPAIPGEFITIFCTGLGAVTPALATGEPGKDNTTVDKPTVTIDGALAAVQFSGIAPGFVGLDQVNVQVPAGIRTANDIPVVLTIGGMQSNTVTIAVSGS